MCQGCFIVEHDEILAIVVNKELFCAVRLGNSFT